MPFAVPAGIGAAATIYSSNKASKASRDAVNAQREMGAAADALSRDQFEWNKWVYENDIEPANKANQELQFLLAEDFLDTSSQQKDFARKQREEYESTFLPIERRMAADAMGYDSEDNVRTRSGRAAADVNQQFSNAIGQRTRALGRYGLASSGGRNQLAKDSLAQAAAASGAATGAAFDTKDRAIALRAGAANFGRNMPNASAGLFSNSNASNAGASNASSASAAAAGASAGFMNNAYNQRSAGIYDAGKAMTNAGLMDAARWNNVTQGLGSFTGSMIDASGGWQGLGNRIGGLFGGGGYAGGMTGFFGGNGTSGD